MFSLITGLLLACSNSTPNTTPDTIDSPVPTVNASPSLDVPGTVATWDGGELGYTDGTKMAQGQMIQLEAEYLTSTYQAAMQSIEQTVLEKLLELEVTAGKFASQDDLLKKEVEDKVIEPTQSEIEAMYEQFKSRLQGMDLASASPLVREQLLRQKQGERFQVYIEDLKTKYNVKITLPYPDLPRQEVSADDDPFLGTDGAPIEIIQFAEFQCPYCGKVGDTMEKLLAEYPGKLKIVYRDFPLGFHDRAIPAAIAANCAGEQDKYWEMHGVLMQNQTKLQDTDLAGFAKEIGVDMATWTTCLKDPAQEAEVNKDMEDASAVGVTGTPAFFINGVLLSGAVPFDQFKSIIDKELAAL
jgi:protein-disulfide isomerase